MNNEILTKAKNVIAEKRRNAEQVAQNQLAIFQQDAEFKKLYTEYIEAMIKAAATPALSKDAESKKSAYETWLKKHNKQAISPNYACKKCQDQGFIDGEMCDCLKKEVTQILIKQSGFLSLESFDKSDFSKFENPKAMQKLYKLMQDWCNQSSHSKTLIFLSGGTGVGKTHLIKCMANELINKSKLVNLTTAFALNQDLVAAYTGFDQVRKAQTMQKYLDCEYLFIDDLGSEIKQQLTVGLLYAIINERKMRRLPTIITSNLDAKDIRDVYDERIASRIIDKDYSICVQLSGKDLRLKQN